MKKSTAFWLLSIQITSIVFIGILTYYTLLNRSRIRATQREVVKNQLRLTDNTTFITEFRKELFSTEDPAPNTLLPGDTAPSFALKNEYNNEVSLADLLGKKTLLVFSQESCPFCQEFYPVLNEFQSQNPNINIAIMQLGTSPDQNLIYKTKQGIESTILAATYDELEAYKITRTPTSVLIDENGKILGVKGISKLNDLTSFVESPVSPTNS